ncbi:MAG: 16S rRNA (cytosine(967)-C(5))-methyltransferase RsmB [Stellaceae bacterium]
MLQDSPGLRARRIALEILLRVEADRAFADVLLGHRLAELDARADRGLVTQLVLGTLAWQGRLDYELARLSSRPLAGLDPRVRALLRMGLYQLRRLTRIPSHAAVDTAVRLANEKRSGDGASGFVNAILRTAIRTPASLPERAGGEMHYLAVAYSHPPWLVAKFVEWFGVDEAEALMAANNLAAPNAIRLNLRRGSAAELTARLERDAMVIAGRGLFPETLIIGGAAWPDCDAFRDGLFTPQAEASQIVVRLLAPPPGATVVDCAAAPGGKSTHLAELVGSQGQVIALDLNLAGLKQVRSAATRLRHGNVHVARSDSSRAIPIRKGSANYVLLDAPCTGLGTLREHPEIRWRVVPNDFARMAHLQLAMIEQAAALLAPSGVLVYAVCSLAPEEGAGVVNDFLAHHSDFLIDPPNRSPLFALIDADGFLRTRPDRASRDGFFAARLKRRAW